MRRAQPPSRIGVVAVPVPEDWSRAWSPASPAQWAAGMAGAEPVRSGSARVVLLAGASEVADALAHPDQWLAIVNAQAELLPVDASHPRGAMLAAIRQYVRRGGVWLETGGYPFWTDVDGGATPPTRSPAVFDGLKALGLTGAAIREPYQDPLPVRLTAVGGLWLGASFAGRLASVRAAVTRPPVGEDYEVALLECSDGGRVLVGSRLRGWGWFLRFCANLDSELAVATARGIVDWLWSHPPERLPAAPGAPELVASRPDVR
jgi:hypothetical protein